MAALGRDPWQEFRRITVGRPLAARSGICRVLPPSAVAEDYDKNDINDKRVRTFIGARPLVVYVVSVVGLSYLPMAHRPTFRDATEPAGSTILDRASWQ